MSRTRTPWQQERWRMIGQAVEAATSHFSEEGFNCAEAVLRGVATTLELPAGEAVLRAATPFGGGMGRAGCVYGALSGAIMALGLAVGRTTPDAEQKEHAYAYAERVWRPFVERAGGEDCREINTLGFQHPHLKAFCGRFVAIAAEVASEELVEA